MERHTRVLTNYSKSKEIEKKTQALFKARKEVDINAGGTSGYTIKHGPNKNKILSHIQKKSTNNW